MTSLLPSAVISAGHPGRRHEASDGVGVPESKGPRVTSLTVVATVSGLTAAVIPLALCLGIGLIGWYSTDGGAHGTPRDGLRVGALGWLMAHGSGVLIDGVAVTMMPLGVTVLAVLSIWRLASRLGDRLATHGPDAGRIVDGERDWTVPVAGLLFAVGYAVSAVVTATVATTPQTAPSVEKVLGWSLCLAFLVGVPAIAIASGRAAIWAAELPETLRGAARTCGQILLVWTTVCLATFVIALAMDLSTAANVISQLDLDAADAVLFSALGLTVLPNAVVFAGSFLMGPGFTMGAATIVSPSVVALGPLPMLPIFAALPESGTPPVWVSALLVVPVVVGLAGAVRAQRRVPTLRWSEGAIRGGAGGVLSGVLFGVIASLAGGSIGPGRMREVAPLAADVLIHAVTTFGLGGLLGGLLITWWQRREARELEESDSSAL